MIERAAKRAAIGVALLRAAGNRAVGYRAGGNRAAAAPSANDLVAEKPADGNQQAGSTAVTLQPGKAGTNGAVSSADTVPAADAAATFAKAVPAADVPRWLRVTAGWAWRLLLLAALLYVAGK